MGLTRQDRPEGRDSQERKSGKVRHARKVGRPRQDRTEGRDSQERKSVKDRQERKMGRQGRIGRKERTAWRGRAERTGI